MHAAPSVVPRDLAPDAPLALHRIFAPLDGSEASDGAFDHARFLARRFGAHLTLYYVLDARSFDDGPGPSPTSDWRRAEGAARAFLSRRAETVPVGAEVRVERARSPHRAIVSFIENHRPDLTVMATHGRRALARVLLGSVTETVVRCARRPVLCVREPDHGVALPYRRILVPTDFSPSSRAAFPMAALFAHAFQAEVLALHVAAEEKAADEGALAAFLQPEFAGLDVVPRVERGSAWPSIVAAARRERADLIVMSTRGHDGIADRVLGSHTERVLRHAPCPVLVTGS